MIATNLEIGERLCVDKITSVQHPGGRRVQDLPEPERTEVAFSYNHGITAVCCITGLGTPPIHHSSPEISEYIHFLMYFTIFPSPRLSSCL